MKRFCCLLLFASVVLCAEGCRRSASEKKPPILVSQEKDFVYGQNTNEIIGKLQPRPKEPLPPPDPNLGKMKAQQNTKLLGEEFLAFLKEKKATPTEQDYERFRSYLRRRGKIELYEALSAKKMEVTFFSFPNHPQHILAWHKVDSDGNCGVFPLEAAPLPLKERDCDDRLRHQELYVVWVYAMKHRLPQYTSMASDALNNMFAVNTPATILAQIKQTQPKLLKDPPETGSIDKFKRYLRDNASPEIFSAVEKNEIRVNPNADLYNDLDLVVCQAQGKGEGKEKRYLTIHCNGVFTGEDAVTIGAKFK